VSSVWFLARCFLLFRRCPFFLSFCPNSSSVFMIPSCPLNVSSIVKILVISFRRGHWLQSRCAGEHRPFCLARFDLLKRWLPKASPKKPTSSEASRTDTGQTGWGIQPLFQTIQPKIKMILAFKNQTLPKNLVRNRAITLGQPRSKSTYDSNRCRKSRRFIFCFFSEAFGCD